MKIGLIKHNKKNNENIELYLGMPNVFNIQRITTCPITDCSGTFHKKVTFKTKNVLYIG